MWLVTEPGTEAVWVRLSGAVPNCTTEVARSSVAHWMVADPFVPTDADTPEIRGGATSMM